MSRDGALTTDWADGAYTFRLGWAQWEMLQESCGCGPWYMQALLFNAAIMVQNPDGVKDLHPKYLAEIIRVGLIGGGMSPADALQKVRTYVHARPPRENFGVAMAILQAGLDGVPEDTAQKKSRPAKRSMTSRKVESASRPSTASVPQ